MTISNTVHTFRKSQLYTKGLNKPQTQSVCENQNKKRLKMNHFRRYIHPLNLFWYELFPFLKVYLSSRALCVKNIKEIDCAIHMPSQNFSSFLWIRCINFFWQYSKTHVFGRAFRGDRKKERKKYGKNFPGL